jgi:hypothetical protein
MKSGSDNIGLFSLYGIALHACQGADLFGWYREAGLSAPRKDGPERWKSYGIVVCCKRGSLMDIYSSRVDENNPGLWASWIIAHNQFVNGRG